MKKGILSFVVLTTVFIAKAQEVYTLEECRQLALNNNKELKIGQEKINQEENKRKAAFTKYLPDISFTGTYLRNSENLSLLSEDAHLPVFATNADGTMNLPSSIKGTVINGTWMPVDNAGKPFNPKVNPEKIVWNNYALLPKEAMEYDIQNVFAGILTVAQPIYMGGKIRAYNQITKYAEELAKTKQNTSTEEVILKTDELYWQVVSLVNKQKLAHSYIQLLEKLDTDVSNMIQSGVATKADGLTIKVKLNEAETSLSKIENGLSLTRMALCQVCGISLQTQFSLKDETSEVEAKTELPRVDLSLAFAQRSELKSLQLAQQIYQKKERLVIADMLPQVLLTGNYIVSNPNSYNGYETKFGSMWNIGVAVRVPIFHWGENFHNLKAAKSETRVMQLQMDEAKEKIELQVNQSLYKSNESTKRLIAARKNMERAEENLRYATLGFSSGVIPTSSVLEAQTAWLSAYSEKIDSEIDVRLSRTYLSKALGELRITN